MAQSQKGRTFDHTITAVENRPQIYVVSSSEKRTSQEEPATLGKTQPRTNGQNEGLSQSAPFFGHSIGKLLTAGGKTVEPLLPMDEKLESSLETIRQKLQTLQAGYLSKGRRLSKEEIKHQRFIEDRNAAQEMLFEDILGRHREFGTGLDADNLWDLHDLMKMEASHEVVCSSEQSIHELVECNLLSFLRKKAGENAWQQVEDFLDRFHITFPMSPSMEDRFEPVRNEETREETKRSARDEFLQTPTLQVAELILGNVPTWVYYYPQRDSYLWRLTVLQGVTAGLEGSLFVKYLSVWEENSTEIVDRIQKEFVGKIDEMRRRGEAAITLPDVLSVSKDLQRISTEEIPDRIWEYLNSKLDNR